jgi:hypothetical protein
MRSRQKADRTGDDHMNEVRVDLTWHLPLYHHRPRLIRSGLAAAPR